MPLELTESSKQDFQAKTLLDWRITVCTEVVYLSADSHPSK